LSDIKYAYPLILNKVASPQYATPVLRRQRLLDWLNQAANCRAAVIAADAGYGKTTLLWQWEREVDFPCYWYKLDRTDRDWTFHISYLIEAISKRHKGFGRRAHSMLQQLGGPGSARPGVTAYLLAEMHQRLTEPCTFIIDDWHVVNAVTEVRGLWNQILRDAPSTCRFVFASRVKPKLQFARFKTHGGYAELRTDALRFTEPEMGELFRDVYNNPLDPAELLELDRRTEGWAASLQLVQVSLAERQTPEQRLEFIRSITATRDSDLFDFLAEEVLDQQPEDTRDFLLATSILQQITPEVAERLTGSHDGRTSLIDLEQRGLFTSQLDEGRYRYHHLFRDFLEHRLSTERAENEVAGLHIHAASYFETTAQWPEAIHHYLRAGLQRQAARLIARYGEQVVEDGRLGLIDEWLRQLPPEAVRANARLNLLWGEACGIRGEWDLAFTALERARSYFARKNDRRMEALACAKLSSVYTNFGSADLSMTAAEDGLRLVPGDAIATRLRLEGNVAVTRLLLNDHLDVAANECLRIASEATRLGQDHFAAIAHHNAGAVQWRMGNFKEAVANLALASKFWSGPPTSPFVDNAELVMAYLCLGDIDRARDIAADAVIRTAPWPRPKADALYGMAVASMARGELEDAITTLEGVNRNPAVLGALGVQVRARLIEAYYLNDAAPLRVVAVAQTTAGTQADPRYRAETAAAAAIAIHVSGACSGQCLTALQPLSTAAARGARGISLIGSVQAGILMLEHGGRGRRLAWQAVEAAMDAGLSSLLRPWFRRYRPFAQSAIRTDEGAKLIARLAEADPDAWRDTLIRLIPAANKTARAMFLQVVASHANRETIEAMRLIDGRDIAEVRRQLQHDRATHMYVRTLGGLSLHRGGWNGSAVPIEKKRSRLLLALLGATRGSTLTRDAAIDLLWPDSDGDAATNSLNQAVFQLRRAIDPTYRGGESPEYVVSTSEIVALNAELVHTDIDDVRQLSARIAGKPWLERQRIAKRTISLVAGELLADLRYESWVSGLQLSVHNEIRGQLLPIASAAAGEPHEVAVATMAASALLALDPYDEAAVIALADCMSKSGRRVAARNLIADYVRRVHIELDAEPSEPLGDAAQTYGAGAAIKSLLTPTASTADKGLT
jgi:ATP/maltotriose-dependent transcriptional regulator MalT/DNA-binding SARP family transcriptional activator